VTQAAFVLGILLKQGNQIIQFPCETIFLPAEVPISGGFAIDWPAQVESVNYSRRSHVNVLENQFSYFSVRNLAGSWVSTIKDTGSATPMA
jgi:hypothetical protein